MRLRSFSRLVLGVALLPSFGACGDDSSDPVSGPWQFDNTGVERNTCNYDQIEIAEGLFEVTNNGDGSLTIDPKDGSEPFECDLDGSDFDCPERLDNESDVMGATLSVHVAARGSFSSATKASGTQSARIECEGASCATLASLVGATLPCEIDASFRAEAE